MKMIECLKVFSPIAVLFLALLPNSSYASIILLLEVTADNLNVRDKPSIDSYTISTLQKGERIVAVPTYRGWFMVLFAGEPFGYVSSDHITIVKVFSSDDEVLYYRDEDRMKCDADSASLNLNITNVEFHCKKDLFRESYESCRTLFDVSISSDCDESMTAYVDCETEFSYETKEGLLPVSSSASSTDSIHIINGRGSAQTIVSWQMRVMLDKVVRVKLKDSSCFISSVYDDC